MFSEELQDFTKKSYQLQKKQLIVSIISIIFGVILILLQIILVFNPQITIKGIKLPPIINIILATALVSLFIIYIFRLPKITNAKLKECNSKYRDLQINMDKQVETELERLWNQILVIEEFSAIMKNLRSFFDQNVNYSFYKILNLDHHREPREKFRLLNNRFNRLYERYDEHLLYNLHTNYKDLRDIIIEAEQMFHFFRPGERRASGFKAGEYIQLKMSYNTTIGKLNFFLKARHEKLGIEFKQTFKPLPD